MKETNNFKIPKKSQKNILIETSDELCSENKRIKNDSNPIKDNFDHLSLKSDNEFGKNIDQKKDSNPKLVFHIKQEQFSPIKNQYVMSKPSNTLETQTVDSFAFSNIFSSKTSSISEEYKKETILKEVSSNVTTENQSKEQQENFIKKSKKEMVKSEIDEGDFAKVKKIKKEKLQIKKETEYVDNSMRKNKEKKLKKVTLIENVPKYEDLEIKEESRKNNNKIKNEDKDLSEKIPVIKKENNNIKKEENFNDDIIIKKEKRKRKKDDSCSNNESEHVWKWWEEDTLNNEEKWKTLEHNGPLLPASYERLGEHVQFLYDGKVVKLSEQAEEVAVFYASMIDHDYTKKALFNTNFFNDWKQEMNSKEKSIIKSLDKCDFSQIAAHLAQVREKKKNMTKEEKNVIKENNKLANIYGICIMDGHKQKIANYKIEPPGLFRGRGEHPKQGKLKKRIQPEDIIINIGENARVPEPPVGHKWKEVIHNNKVAWLANWVENITGSNKYILLNPTAKLKGEKDYAKYELARKLKDKIEGIRKNYFNDLKSDSNLAKQRATALYLIDRFALRAGNEKDEDTADTVGCCSLRYEHIKTHKQLDDQKYVIEFDFLGKDSIRYVNKVSVDKQVFKNINSFMKDKSEGDDIFDRLKTSSLNKYLSDLMPGLTAKVFRTFNASFTLQDQLNKLTDKSSTPSQLLLTYNRANRAVAILCNHQRAVPKTHEKSMENLKTKINEKRNKIEELKELIEELNNDPENNSKEIIKKEISLAKSQDQLLKLEIGATDKEENKEIALGTSKLNYIDPRINVAWCKKFNVPIEKIYSKTQREKFQWAIEMTDQNFVF